MAKILDLITGLLPGKKKSGYFMELVEVAEEKLKEAQEALKSDQEKAEAAKASNGSKPAPVVEPAVKLPEPVAAVATQAKEVASASAKAVKATKPAKKAQEAKTVENGKVAAEVTPTPAPTPAKLPTPTETTFAPKYLAPSSTSNGRRRPGANMNSYLEMARQVKKPN
jgi:hypothetical protein